MKFKEKTIREVDYNDLDEFISQEFGIEYESIPYEEWNNYESHSLEVEAKEMNKYTKAKMERKNYHFILSELLNHLCFTGKLEPGEYLINIFY